MGEPLPRPDPEQTFAQLAEFAPTAESTRRALARVQAALPKARPARRLRWIVPASIAAAVLVALTITLALLPAKASAEEMLATTLKANEEYKGWVHLTYGKEDKTIIHWNTQNGDFAAQYQAIAPHDSPAKPGIAARFVDKASGLFYDYHNDIATIRIGAWSPERHHPGSNTPLSFAGLLDQLHEVAGENAVKITQSQDRGRDRFDITIAKPAADQMPEEFQSGAGSLGRPTTVWVDPGTKLIRAAVVDGKEINVAYGPPEFHSIYDAGVPRDAKIIDNRPTPEALAVVNRLRARIDKPFPDGIVVKLTYASSSAELQLYYRAGANWAARAYRVALPSETSPQVSSIQLPDHWQDAGSEELFRRMAAVFPESETGGDGTTAWDGEFDPVTGEQFLSYGIQDFDVSGKSRYRSGKAAGRQTYAGATAKSMERNFSPLLAIYPQEINMAFTTDNHLDLITAPDQPGELAFRVLFPDEAPGSLRFMTQEWFDPAHDDRSVLFQKLVFASSTSRQVEWRTDTRFAQYANLPLPDGRSYPTAWTETNYDGAGNISDTRFTEFRFFPGRQLPDIPRKLSRP